MDQQPISAREAITYLKSFCGCKYSGGYLAKLRCIGGGPIFTKIGSSVFYYPTDLDNWIRGNTTRRMKSTSSVADQCYEYSHQELADNGWVDME